MNLGQSFLIPPPHLTAEAATVLARFRMRIKRDGTICLSFPLPFSCAANLVSFNSASPSAFRGRVCFYVGFFFFLPPLASFSFRHCLPWRVHRNGLSLWQLELFPSPPRWTGNCLRWAGFHTRTAPLLTMQKTAQSARKHLKVRTKTKWMEGVSKCLKP